MLFKKAWNKMNETYIRYVNNEKGAQALEWVALGLVVLAIMGVIAAGLQGDTSLGKSIIKKLKDMIEGL
ncbi:hypothetical protein [Robertmurraya andreesenii]|uniref:Flagellar motor switch protein FliM n=1 Tax=Anoxybacillus andreesenii TaxID=1325932 RepID=A0ABT9V885_9BACL|nr:hypothetical protein [Robertmurraya andreesenii]MDQ0157128.1 flagellar motor switch protein FliM [Robertmurraya andreesenii]